MVVPEVEPGPGGAYLWAHEFKLVGGEGGFLGLQTGSDLAGDGGAKAAVFSIAGTAAPTCRIPLAWEAGREYGMRVWTDDEGGWSAGVRDRHGGRELLIGTIGVPEGWRRLASWSMMRTEYQGAALARCRDLPPCRVTFSVPTADGGTERPDRHVSQLGPGTCESSSVETVPGGVRHTVGEL